jgi:uncharacterized protein (TIGR03086 family)
VTGSFDDVLDRFVLASAQFEQLLRTVRAEQWDLPTPCTEWNVRKLVNHMTRGNLSYIGLAAGGTSEQFLRLRDEDALGADPVAAYVRSARQCAEAFAEPGALQRILDYPLGRVPGGQALAVRTTDSVIHTWDLARAVGADERLNPGLVAWIDAGLDAIYAGLAETPADLDTTHRFFAAPEGTLATDASRQERLLHRMGRMGRTSRPDRTVGRGD